MMEIIDSKEPKFLHAEKVKVKEFNQIMLVENSESTYALDRSNVFEGTYVYTCQWLDDRKSIQKAKFYESSLEAVE